MGLPVGTAARLSLAYAAVWNAGAARGRWWMYILVILTPAEVRDPTKVDIV
jgi:hypothetical protein